MNVLIVPNSFKECAYSPEIARQIVTSLKNYLYFNTVEESIGNYKTGINLACKEISEYFLFNK